MDEEEASMTRLPRVRYSPETSIHNIFFLVINYNRRTRKKEEEEEEREKERKHKSKGKSYPRVSDESKKLRLWSFSLLNPNSLHSLLLYSEKKENPVTLSFTGDS